MADEPIRERILQHCKTSLLGMQQTSDFHFSPKSVTRGRANPDPTKLGELPAIFFTEDDEGIEEGPNPVLSRTLPIMVEAWVQSDYEELATMANRMLADLERSMTCEANRTRGDLAIGTRITGNRIRIDEPPGSLASVQADFEIRYQTVEGDPSAIG